MKIFKIFETFLCLIIFGHLTESKTVLEQILQLENLENGLNITEKCRSQLLETKDGVMRKELWGIKCEWKILQ